MEENIKKNSEKNSEKKLGKNKISFITLGCKVNQYETNAMIEECKNEGFEVIEPSSKSDIIVVNTCTVTNVADKKSRQFLKRAKKLNPECIVVCTGCMADIEKENMKLDYVDLVIGNTKKVNLAQKIQEYIDYGKSVDVDENRSIENYGEFPAVSYTDKVRAVIKIQDGCNQFCTYCIIPYARGVIRSRDKENIFAEVEQIVKKGLKEIVLTGIHIASFGKDFADNSKNGYYLIDLLEDLDKISGIERIRLGSIEPLLMNDDTITRMKKLNKLCHQFHLSLQSANNFVLKRMNRKYTIEEFEKICDNLRNAFEDTIITTDIITGFPGENEEFFEDTLHNLEKLKLYKMHVFPYSERKGTPAAKFKEAVDLSIRKSRAKRIIELSDKLEKEYLKKCIDTVQEVLIENCVGNYYVGHTKNFLKVYIDRKILEGESINAKKEKSVLNNKFVIKDKNVGLYNAELYNDKNINTIVKVKITGIYQEKKNILEMGLLAGI